VVRQQRKTQGTHPWTTAVHVHAQAPAAALSAKHVAGACARRAHPFAGVAGTSVSAHTCSNALAPRLDSRRVMSWNLLERFLESDHFNHDPSLTVAYLS
jgi:hypothetical protein